MKSPLIFLIAAVILSTITLIAQIAVNCTVANEPDNDLGSGTGWAILMPAPVLSFIWSLIDLTFFFTWRYHNIYWLTVSALLASLYTSLGGLGIAMYAWSDEGAWVGGMFLLFMAVFYWISLIFAAMSVHKGHMSFGKAARTERVAHKKNEFGSVDGRSEV